MLIRTLTGGDVCYGQPINLTGAIMVIIFSIIAWELIKWTIRRNT